jgi:hypothetical protein
MTMLGPYSENEHQRLFSARRETTVKSPTAHSPRLTTVSRLAENCREHRLMRAGSPRRLLDRAAQLSGQWSKGPSPARPHRKMEVEAILRSKQLAAIRAKGDPQRVSQAHEYVANNYRISIARLWHKRNPASNIFTISSDNPYFTKEASNVPDHGLHKTGLRAVQRDI